MLTHVRRQCFRGGSLSDHSLHLSLVLLLVSLLVQQVLQEQRLLLQEKRPVGLGLALGEGLPRGSGALLLSRAEQGLIWSLGLGLWWHPRLRRQSLRREQQLGGSRVGHKTPLLLLVVHRRLSWRREKEFFFCF